MMYKLSHYQCVFLETLLESQDKCEFNNGRRIELHHIIKLGEYTEEQKKDLNKLREVWLGYLKTGIIPTQYQFTKDFKKKWKID